MSRVKEEMRTKDKEGKLFRERLKEERKMQEKNREARNKEWRLKRDRRGKSPREDKDVSSLDEVLVAELVCSTCKGGLWRGPLFQCNEGHLACEQCKPEGCVVCQTSFQARNKALERLRGAMLAGQ